MNELISTFCAAHSNFNLSRDAIESRLNERLSRSADSFSLFGRQIICCGGAAPAQSRGTETRLVDQVSKMIKDLHGCLIGRPPQPQSRFGQVKHHANPAPRSSTVLASVLQIMQCLSGADRLSVSSPSSLSNQGYAHAPCVDGVMRYECREGGETALDSTVEDRPASSDAITRALQV